MDLPMHSPPDSTGVTPVAPVAVTPENISNGWRVAEVSDAGAFASCVTVLSRGEIRRDILSRDFPRAFEQDLSLLPVVNWQFLPDGRNESVFWHGSTPSNTLIATWWNAALGRDATNPVCFQAELYTKGGFDYRYEDRTVRHVRVWPFDLDDDGLENSVDPDPLVAGPDAHGTNAEWYNVVCTNVLEAVAATSAALPPELTWREGVNTNAYYFVDVVTERGPAPIYFTGDHESRLGNPVVVARAFETNHVPLLIGIDYAITSPMQFSVSLPDEGFATIITNDVSNYNVRWPLEFSVLPDGIGYRVSVVPYNPGCEFRWPTPTRSVTCNYTTDGGWIGFSCCGSGNCGCDGCSVAGEAVLEDTTFDLPDVWCGCWRYDPLDPGTGPTFTNVPYVAVSFDKSVVFYEDAYTNAVSDVVAKHSTNTTLTVFAYGGEAGGMLYVSERNIGKLIRVGGKAIAFPYTAFVPPHSGVSFSIVYEAEMHSDSEGDITVSASLTPGDGGGIIGNSASTTAVKVAVTPEWATGDDLLHRHQFGVCEKVWCEAYPTGMGVSWRCDGNGSLVQSGAHYRHQVPFDARNYVLSAEIGDVVIPLTVRSLFPADLLVINDSNRSIVVLTNSISAGEAGCVGIYLPLCCSPTNVSFANIELREFETPATLFTQYFATTNWIGLRDHQGSAISADWFTPGAGNYFADDVAYLGYCAEPWLGGGNLEWNIPDVCRPLDPSMSCTNVFQTTEQTFTLTADGTARVMKFGYMVERMTNETINLWRPYED